MIAAAAAPRHAYGSVSHPAAYPQHHLTTPQLARTRAAAYPQLSAETPQLARSLPAVGS
jgi:hypothetical protein